MGERSLDVRFTWEFSEWELDLEVDFLHILESNRPSMENGDRMRWKLKKNGDFDIHSFIMSCEVASLLVFPWKGIWKVKTPRHLFFCFNCSLG